MDFAGTSKVAQILVSELNKLPHVNAYLLYRDGDGGNNRLDEARELLGEDRLVPFHCVGGETIKNAPFIPAESNLSEVLQRLNPDIMHVHRSGYEEWPAIPSMKQFARHWVETNIFGDVDRTGVIDQHIFISKFIADRAHDRGCVQGRGSIIYNPCLPPFLPDGKSLTQHKIKQHAEMADRLGVPVTSLFLGRVGRAANFDAISLRAFQMIEKSYPNAYYLVVNPCNRWKEVVGELGLKNVRFLDPITSDRDLSNYLASLDIYAHARGDGECCPCNIQEAMYHGLPVVTHEGATFQGQREIVGDCGFCVPRGDHVQYADRLHMLLEKRALRGSLGYAAKNRALEYFDATSVTYNIWSVYWRLMNEAKP